LEQVRDPMAALTLEAEAPATSWDTRLKESPKVAMAI